MWLFAQTRVMSAQCVIEVECSARSIVSASDGTSFVAIGRHKAWRNDGVRFTMTLVVAIS